MLLVMDVGNTHTVLGVYDGEQLRAHWRLTTVRDRTVDEYGTTPGFHIALDDMPPPIFFSNTMKAVMQEILAGTRDVDKLLKMLDDDWDSALKGM